MTKRKPKPWNPTKLSELIRDAVHDAQEIEKREGYVLNMNAWHVLVDGVCRVCMAGAIMVCRLGVKREVYARPENFSKRVDDLLLAVDAVRVGRLGLAFEYMGLEFDCDLSDRLNLKIRSAMNGLIARAQWPTYLEVADELERAGL